MSAHAPVDLTDTAVRGPWLAAVAAAVRLLAASASDATSPTRIYSRRELKRRARRAARSLRKLLVAAGVEPSALAIPDHAPASSNEWPST
jgi:hypothetical protein